MSIKVSVVVVYDEVVKKFLLLKKQDYFYCPGGKLESGESWIIGAIRELNEETGIRYQDAPLTKFKDYRTSLDKRWDLVVFSLHLTRERLQKVNQITLSKEHSEFRWVSISELETLNLYPTNITILKDFIETYKLK